MNHTRINPADCVDFECPVCGEIVKVRAGRLPTEEELSRSTNHTKRKTCGKLECKRSNERILHQAAYWTKKQQQQKELSAS